MIQESALIESLSLRNQFIEHTEVLDKVKRLAMLPDDLHVTTEMVATYFETGQEAIQSLIKDHREELETDGVKTIEGAELKSLKDSCQIQSRAKHLTLIPRRAVLRIGMLLRDSPVARKVRDYLLDTEKAIPAELRLVIADGQMDQIRQMIAEEIGKYLPLKAYRNPSSHFEELLNIFHRKVHPGAIPGGSQRYFEFYREYEKWLGSSLPNNQKLLSLGYESLKQYLLNNRLDDLESFITKIGTGQMVRTQGGGWVDLNGFRANRVEFERTLNEFGESCAYCGIKSEKLRSEHIIPQGNPESSDQIWNIVPACPSCNTGKYGENWLAWYRRQPFYSELRAKRIAAHVIRYKPMEGWETRHLVSGELFEVG